MSDLIDKLFASRGKAAKSVLAGLPGVRIPAGREGVLQAGNAEARIVEEDDWLYVVASIKKPPDPAEAMRRNGELPGNQRFARQKQGVRLIADTQVDGAAHLPDTFAEFRAGLGSVASGRAAKWKRPSPVAEEPPAAEEPPVEGDTVDALLSQLGWGDDRVVRLANEWELRPRHGGRPFPVRLEVAAGNLRIHQTVLTVDRPSRPAVADAALRLNGQVRFARYVLADDRLVAESLLHAGLWHPRWIAEAANAVAVACRHARPLELLTRGEEVRMWYCRLFRLPVPL